jgi:hypothetical protein
MSTTRLSLKDLYDHQLRAGCMCALPAGLGYDLLGRTLAACRVSLPRGSQLTQTVSRTDIRSLGLELPNRLAAHDQLLRQILSGVKHHPILIVLYQFADAATERSRTSSIAVAKRLFEHVPAKSACENRHPASKHVDDFHGQIQPTATLMQADAQIGTSQEPGIILDL